MHQLSSNHDWVFIKCINYHQIMIESSLNASITFPTFPPCVTCCPFITPFQRRLKTRASLQGDRVGSSGSSTWRLPIDVNVYQMGTIPLSPYHLVNIEKTMERSTMRKEWVNPRTKSPCSIAMWMFTRGYLMVFAVSHGIPNCAELLSI